MLNYSIHITEYYSFLVFKVFLNLHFLNEDFLMIILAMLCSMWDLSSPIKDRTETPCNGSLILTTGLPGKSLIFKSI